MEPSQRTTSPEFWLAQLFAAKSVRNGAVVRKSIRWVDREVGRERFMAAVRQRGFHLIRTADQYLVICHNGPVHFEF